MSDRSTSRQNSESAASRPVGRPSGPTAQGALSRDVIIDAAARVFSRVGYERARMADVVDASGMSKGSVYFHFDSKTALAIAVLTARHEKWIAAVTEMLGEAPDAQARLRALLPAMLTLHRTDPDSWVIARLSQSLAQVDETRETVSALMSRWIDLVASVIQDAHPGLEDLGINPGALATVVVGSFDGTKAIVEIVGSERTGDLEMGGALLERMLLAVISPAQGERVHTRD